MVLSFVIPAYNEELYLADCIESILRQTACIELPTEIIVVNNASTDRTAEIALRYTEVQLVNEPRKGLPQARQAGFMASTGRLVANVDADSRLTPGWVESVLRAFLANPSLAAISGPLLYYDLPARQRALVHVFYLSAWTTYIANRYILRVGSMVQGGNFVVSRAALQSIGGFNLDITFYGEDTDIARRLHDVGDVVFTFDLKMFSSARRLKKEGLVTMALRYSANYFWTTFLKRPYSQHHIDVREVTEG